MWLDKALAKLFGPPKKPPLGNTELSPLSRCELALHNLGLPEPIELTAFAAQGWRISPAYSSIELYVDRLREFEKKVIKNSPITALLFSNNPSGISLDLFFVSEDNHYLDKYDAIVNFHLAATLLCKALAKVQDDKFGVGEHNYRVLTIILQDVTHICDVINQARTIN